MLTRFVFLTPSGKNWDLTAALSDFEQLRQVHAGSLSYSFPEQREPAPTEHKDMTRVGRPLLHRQDDVVQGEDSLPSLSERERERGGGVKGNEGGRGQRGRGR